MLHYRYHEIAWCYREIALEPVGPSAERIRRATKQYRQRSRGSCVTGVSSVVSRSESRMTAAPGSTTFRFPIRRRTDYPLLFDRQGKPKPAFYAVLKAASRDNQR